MKVVVVCGSIVFGLGTIMYFSDRQLFESLNWFQPNAVRVVNCYRWGLIALQVLLTVIVLPAIKRGGQSKKAILFGTVALAMGFILSALGWLKIDSLLQDLSLI